MTTIGVMSQRGCALIVPSVFSPPPGSSSSLSPLSSCSPAPLDVFPQNWSRSMERYGFPCVGSRPVSEVNTADVLEILSPIWHAKAATAREFRQRIRSVLEWAIAL